MAEEATKTKPKKSDLARRRGKKYAEKHALVEAEKLYPLKEAVDLVPEISYAKFDATCEVHLNINCDTKQADQIVRSTIVLPHGTGKTQRIAAFVTDANVKAAKSAGADLAGHEDLIEDVKGGKIDFDIAVAEPAVMKDLGKIAKVLGQKGLMPSPKAGTVSADIEGTVKEIKQGKIEFRTDKQGIIHCPFGKVSFGADKLHENLKVLLKAILDARPSGIKGTYIKTINVTTSMSPSVSIDTSTLAAAVKS